MPQLFKPALLLACLAAGCTAPPETGRTLYDANCAACHGPTGKGDGPAVAGLPRRPADLTGIAARNGGTFPVARVMSTIDGYFRADGDVMPHFGNALTSDQVLIDTGDGILTPAPEHLVALAEYLRTLGE